MRELYLTDPSYEAASRMIKYKLHVTAVVCLLSAFYFLAPDAYCGVSLSSGPISASATIASEFTLKIRIEDQVTKAITPTMNFGELVRVNDNELRAATFFKVYIELDTLGAASHLTQTASPLTREGGSETMPNGAYIVQPTYDPADNGNLQQPSGSNLGKRQSAVGTEEIYTDPTGSHRTVTSLYFLSGDSTIGATEPITLNQKSGAYSGTIQYTLTSE